MPYRSEDEVLRLQRRISDLESQLLETQLQLKDQRGKYVALHQEKQKIHQAYIEANAERVHSQDFQTEINRGSGAGGCLLAALAMICAIAALSILTSIMAARPEIRERRRPRQEAPIIQSRETPTQDFCQ